MLADKEMSATPAIIRSISPTLQPGEIHMPAKGYRCPPGCQCGLHGNGSCPPGCDCWRHSGDTFRGRTHSDKTKAKISAANTGKRHPCPPGCQCGRHNRPVTTPKDPEERRVHKRQVNRDWYAKNPRSKEKTIEQHLSTRHGMRPADRDAMREDQGGRCCYCERPLPENPRQVHIDHDHSCTCGPKKSCQYCRRGLACEACNTIIGKLDEDWDRLERIAANGRRLQAEARARINNKPVQTELFDINEAARRREESALWLLAKA